MRFRQGGCDKQCPDIVKMVKFKSHYAFYLSGRSLSGMIPLEQIKVIFVQYVFRLSFLVTALAGLVIMSSISNYYGKAQASDQVIVAFGDSLTAGYGLEQGQGFPSQLEVWLQEQGVAVTVKDAGVSGDTTAGGLSRLNWVLASLQGEKPDLLILELGANDGLRGVDPAVTRRNLYAMMKQLTEKDIPVLIAGMLASPSMGPEYVEAFNSIFPDLAKTYDAPLYPFFLEGVAGDPALNLGDGVHPTAEGISIIVGKIGPMVKEALE